jgi:hypothetical protein
VSKASNASWSQAEATCTAPAAPKLQRSHGANKSTPSSVKKLPVTQAAAAVLQAAKQRCSLLGVLGQTLTRICWHMLRLRLDASHMAAKANLCNMQLYLIMYL